MITAEQCHKEVEQQAENPWGQLTMLVPSLILWCELGDSHSIC